MSETMDLLNWTPPDYNASGKTFVEKRDRKRISNQCRKVWGVVSDGRWHTLEQIKSLTGASEASISARIRDLKNKHKCAYEKVYVAKGLWRYRFDPDVHPKPEEAK